jgi:RNA polymerase sigma-B factor
LTEHGRPLFDTARIRVLVERLHWDRSARDELMRLHLPLVEALARRFRSHWEPLEDLTQVATLGLLMAMERFDPSRGVEFSAFATPTIIGELKHFRDKSWMVNVPRRLRDIGLELNSIVPELAQELGHSPAVSEIAQSSGYSQEEVLEAMQISNAYSPASLDALVPFGEEEHPIPGVEEKGFELLELKWSVALLVNQLPARERELVYLRFYVGQNQRQIAEKLGISQMHVSRLLDKTLAHLREAAAIRAEAETLRPRTTLEESRDATLAALRLGGRRYEGPPLLLGRPGPPRAPDQDHDRRS